MIILIFELLSFGLKVNDLNENYHFILCINTSKIVNSYLIKLKFPVKIYTLH